MKKAELQFPAEFEAKPSVASFGVPQSPSFLNLLLIGCSLFFTELKQSLVRSQ
jgi:hypothetical protein